MFKFLEYLKLELTFVILWIIRFYCHKNSDSIRNLLVKLEKFLKFKQIVLSEYGLHYNTCHRLGNLWQLNFMNFCNPDLLLDLYFWIFNFFVSIDTQKKSDSLNYLTVHTAFQWDNLLIFNDFLKSELAFESLWIICCYCHYILNSLTCLLEKIALRDNILFK